MTSTAERDEAYRVVTKERFFGDPRRWRRFGEPVPAGSPLADGGTADEGLFGPGSLFWEVTLHPAMMFLQTPAQVLVQLLYKPIAAGIRDRDPVARKAAQGTLTVFDVFERGQRNAGMHAPMWLGDTETAQRMWKHLHNIHRRVEAGLIDAGEPELGGYSAVEPRDAMWAALTEIHPMLCVYEAFAYRDGRPPHRMTDAERDRYVAETVPYVTLVGGDPDEAPRSMAELDALYERDAALWRRSASMDTSPETMTSFVASVKANVKKNFHRSQLRVFAHRWLEGRFHDAILGAMGPDFRRRIGMTDEESARAQRSVRRLRPLAWVMQRGPVERYYMRLMWGPDGVELITSARRLHAQAKAAARRSAS